MPKPFIPALALSFMAIGAAQADLPILQTENLFAIVTDVSGGEVSAALVHSAISKDGATILPVGSVFHGKLSSTSGTRVSVCFTDLVASVGQSFELAHVGPAFPHAGCLAQIHDYSGAAGIEQTSLRAGEAVRVYLNGDLYISNTQAGTE